MTFQEFRAWLEGFEEAFDAEHPSPEQWAKIKAKLADVGPAQRSYEPGKPFIQPWIEPRIRYLDSLPPLQPTVYGDDQTRTISAAQVDERLGALEKAKQAD